MSRRILIAAIICVMLPLVSFPIAIVIYGGGGMAAFGFAIVGGLLLLQLPLLLVMKRVGALPGREHDR